MKTIIFAIIAGIVSFILATIEKQAGWDLGIAPYIVIGIVCGLLSIAADKDNQWLLTKRNISKSFKMA